MFTIGQTIEKGKRHKQFTIQPVVRANLLRWLACDRPLSISKYLFPSHKAERGHISRSSVQALFARVAARAGVSGPHVHIHTTRHTVAFELFEAGNRLEYVAKFLGHTPAVCEKFYLKFCHADVMKHIQADFLLDVGNTEQQTLPTTETFPKVVVNDISKKRSRENDEHTVKRRRRSGKRSDRREIRRQTFLALTAVSEKMNRK